MACVAFQEKRFCKRRKSEMCLGIWRYGQQDDKVLKLESEGVSIRWIRVCRKSCGVVV